MNDALSTGTDPIQYPCDLAQQEVDVWFSGAHDPPALERAYDYLKGYVRGLRNGGSISPRDYYVLSHYVDALHNQLVEGR